jgi:fibronectin type 3 domain-containing protein
MVKKIGLLFLMLMVTVFSNCGKKGPLRLEPGLVPKGVENVQISQVGKHIKLQWDFPQTLADKRQTEMEMDKIDKIYIYYSKKEILGGKFRKKSTLLRKLKMEDLSPVTEVDTTTRLRSQTDATTTTVITEKENLSYYVMIPFKLNDLDNNVHFFGVQYYYQKKRSPLGNVVYINTRTPLKPVTGLKVIQENKVNKLTWTRPQQDEADNIVGTIAGYKIYRKIDPEEEAESKGAGETGKETASMPKPKGYAPGLTGFKKLNQDNVLSEYYEDMDTGTNGTYSYYVSTIISNQIESESSAPVSIKVADIYPPEVPANPVIFRATDHMFLTWKAVTDLDLSHYRVYRRSPPQEEFRLFADEITTNHYKDTKDLIKGKTYFYVVTAVDKKGNESEYSITVKERF